MGKESDQLRDWYATVIGDEGTAGSWAEAVMTDPENGIVYTRLAACAVATTRMMLRLAQKDQDPETFDRVRQAMLGVLEEDMRR